jgi:hypothetical protein
MANGTPGKYTATISKRARFARFLSRYLELEGVTTLTQDLASGAGSGTKERRFPHRGAAGGL